MIRTDTQTETDLREAVRLATSYAADSCNSIGTVQRQNACTNRRQFGAICTEPGNLRLRRTTWWSWEDSNLQPSGYCQEMGEAQCNHSPNIDQRLTKKTPAAISVGETVGPLSWGLAKCWSEWQDLNLRPPRPERGDTFRSTAHAHCKRRRPLRWPESCRLMRKRTAGEVFNSGIRCIAVYFSQHDSESHHHQAALCLAHRKWL
jgi:hypothetical protein